MLRDGIAYFDVIMPRECLLTDITVRRATLSESTTFFQK